MPPQFNKSFPIVPRWRRCFRSNFRTVLWRSNFPWRIDGYNPQSNLFMVSFGPFGEWTRFRTCMEHNRSRYYQVFHLSFWIVYNGDIYFWSVWRRDFYFNLWNHQFARISRTLSCQSGLYLVIICTIRKTNTNYFCYSPIGTPSELQLRLPRGKSESISIRFQFTLICKYSRRSMMGQLSPITPWANFAALQTHHLLLLQDHMLYSISILTQPLPTMVSTLLTQS